MTFDPIVAELESDATSQKRALVLAVIYIKSGVVPKLCEIATPNSGLNAKLCPTIVCLIISLD